MKYSVPYYSDFRFFDNVDEVILKYSEHNDNIIDFVDEHFRHQRVVVDITEKTKEINDIIPVICKLQAEHDDMTVKTTKDAYKELAYAGVPFFFDAFCYTDDEVYAFINRGISDVYIVSNLGFNLKEVGMYCRRKGVNVRVIPNMAQYPLDCKEDIPAACKFFIRPEDTELYEDYVGTFEFVAPIDRLSVLFQIYKSKQWLGDLKDLIIGLDTSIINTSLVPDFGKQRLKCRHRCMQEECDLCIQMQKLANYLDEHEVKITKERDKSWNKDESRINEKSLSNGDTTTL